jgi:hypothetical protein
MNLIYGGAGARVRGLAALELQCQKTGNVIIITKIGVTVPRPVILDYNPGITEIRDTINRGDFNHVSRFPIYVDLQPGVSSLDARHERWSESRQPCYTSFSDKLIWEMDYIQGEPTIAPPCSNWAQPAHRVRTWTAVSTLCACAMLNPSTHVGIVSVRGSL